MASHGQRLRALCHGPPKRSSSPVKPASLSASEMCFVSDEVHDRIDRKAADKLAAIVDDRREIRLYRSNAFAAASASSCGPKVTASSVIAVATLREGSVRTRAVSGSAPRRTFRASTTNMRSLCGGSSRNALRCASACLNRRASRLWRRLHASYTGRRSIRHIASTDRRPDDLRTPSSRETA